MHEGLTPIRIAAAAIAASCFAAAMLAIAVPVLAARPAPIARKPIGPMSSFQYLIGSWTCAGTPKSAASTVKLSFTVAANNTVQVASRSQASTVLGFYGFDAVPKLWWWATVDSDGGRSFQTSRDWANYVGTIETRENSFPLRTTMIKSSDTKIRIVTEEQIDGTWVRSGDTTCTKS